MFGIILKYLIFNINGALFRDDFNKKIARYKGGYILHECIGSANLSMAAIGKVLRMRKIQVLVIICPYIIIFARN